jgi:hypothetical protein
MTMGRRARCAAGRGYETGARGVSCSADTLLSVGQKHLPGCCQATLEFTNSRWWQHAFHGLRLRAAAADPADHFFAGVHTRVRGQVWSGHPCNWHITEPVEVTDYQVSPTSCRSRRRPAPRSRVCALHCCRAATRARGRRGPGAA